MNRQPAIEVRELTKRYRGHTVVDSLSFDVAPGSITAMLGPNGAGKSTSLRMICGLARPSSGSTQVLGCNIGALPNPARHVGVMLDAGAHHPGRTGGRILDIAATQMRVSRGRSADLLELVGLSSARKKRFGDYSLGMRQRLGIAQALLGSPSILILDEPANGLDPQGIAWMRGFLADFVAEGRGAVLLSSHHLREVQLIATHAIVIAGGRLVAERDIVAEQAANSRSCRVETRQVSALASALQRRGIEFAVVHDHGFNVEAEPEVVGGIAVDDRIVLSGLSARPVEDLERTYALTLTDGEIR